MNSKETVFCHYVKCKPSFNLISLLIEKDWYRGDVHLTDEIYCIASNNYLDVHNLLDSLGILADLPNAKEKLELFS